MRYAMLAALVALPACACFDGSYYERSPPALRNAPLHDYNNQARDCIKAEMRSVAMTQFRTQDPHEYLALEERFVDLLLAKEMLEKRGAMLSESFSQG